MRTQRHLWTRYFRTALLPVRPVSENELPGFFESNRRGIRRDHGPSSFGVTRNDPLGFAISRLPARPSQTPVTGHTAKVATPSLAATILRRPPLPG